MSTARQLAADLEYYQTNDDSNEEIITTLKQSNNKLHLLSEEYILKVSGLEKDKLILNTRGDKFESLYTTCSKSLQDCESSKPSRLVWFGVGAISVLVLTVTGLIFIK